jgi:MFS family permease
VLATGLSHYSFAAPLHFCTALTVVALLLLARYREEPAAERRIDWSSISLWEGVRCFRDAAGDGLVRGILGCFILMQVAWGGFFVFVSVYLMEAPGIDLTLSEVGVFMAIIGIGFCVSNGLVQPMLAGRFEMRTLAVTGLGLNAATMVLCLMATSAYQAYAAGLMAGITINIAYPSIVTMLSDRVTPERQGWILGMVGSAAAMGWAISSVVSGGLGGLGHALPIVLAAILMACATLAMTVAGADWRKLSEAQGKSE